MLFGLASLPLITTLMQMTLLVIVHNVIDTMKLLQFA